MTRRAHTTAIELPDEGQLTIGRSSGCDVFVDEEQVSRRHAVLHVFADRIEIEDLGSQNGTVILGSRPAGEVARTGPEQHERLPPNTIVPLSTDALIQIGTALITIQAAPDRHRLQSQPGIPGFVVADPAMERVLALADRAAPTPLTVLLLGESGTGKEMLARYLHERSPRAKHRMISLNCGALPETLLESELFGFEKGAFTGASAAKLGLFEAAHFSTLFLDEVGELSPSLQVKLLRVLEDRQVLRIGAVEPRDLDVRFIAATNRDLDGQVAAGKFREDLYYRLYGIALHLPALRDRRADIIPLAERFLEDLRDARSGPPIGLSQAARAKLHAHDWPGNVRQLKNVIHRALVMCTGHEIGAAEIELGERETRAPAPSLDVPPEQLRHRADDAERRKILEALDECAGNQTRAARRLGLTRRALVRRLEKYDLPRPRRNPATSDEE